MHSDPPSALLLENIDPDGWEARAVVAKFGDRAAVFGEENVDYVAMGSMSHPAAAYWLPRLIDYLQGDAPPDSFHLESLLPKLADADWAQDVQAHLSAPDKARVAGFLEWLSDQPFMEDAPPLRVAAHAGAASLWPRKA